MIFMKISIIIHPMIDDDDNGDFTFSPRTEVKLS